MLWPARPAESAHETARYTTCPDSIWEGSGCQVQIARLKAVDQAWGRILYELQIDVGVFNQERGNASGNEIGHDRRNRAACQAALDAGEQTLHGVPGIRKLAQDRLRLGQQPP
jgi:hypothetical protein